MSRRAVSVLLLCSALAACREEPPAAPEPAEVITTLPATPDADVDNALGLMYGGAVVSRGGELHLENSAVHTLDGFVETAWISAPGVPEETLVFSMLGPTRLQRVGVSTAAGEDVMESVAFDASPDGKTWTELGTLKTSRTDERQFLTVKPTVAQYLRLRLIDPAGHYYVRLRGVHVIGEEVGRPRTPSFGGCWTINGVPARLEQNGARITGTIESDPPTVLDGGTDNRAGMVMWMRGPTWGYAVITRSPDGEHLSGLSFFEEVNMHTAGEGWFGERCDAGRQAAGGPAAGPAAFLERTKRYSLYGLAFDANDGLIEELSAPTLDALASLVSSSSQRLRVIAHELRYATPEQNQQHAAARVHALRSALGKRGVNLARIDFVAAGSDWNGPILRSALQRALVSRVDLVSGT
ncbi:MAG: discoidin domain-containing protein [Thermoanaerobaculia bacterium]